MTAQMIGGPEVNRPTPDPLTSSVLDHATVVDLTKGFGYRNNEGLWPSYNCLDLLTPTAGCPVPMVGQKVFVGASWQPAFNFAVYGGTQCHAIGLDQEDQEAETVRVFRLSEGKGVERALREIRFVAAEEPGSDDPISPYFGQWDAPEDLTPGMAVSLPVALALLEGDAAAKYVGLPTIHMPRAAATVLEVSGLIVWNGGKAYTKNGSKVAIGGGYDDPEMLASGLWDMYATGEVYVERAPLLGPWTRAVIPGMVDPSSDGNDLTENAVMTLVERQFRVAIDCYVAKSTGRVWEVTP